MGRKFALGTEYTGSLVFFSSSRKSVLNAIKYMKEHYFEKLSSDDIARQFTVSPGYFRYLFKTVTSKTFTAYLNGLRISKAMELLGNTDKCVLDICYEVGFNNINHFNRLFSRQTGKISRRTRSISQLRNGVFSGIQKGRAFRRLGGRF